MYQRPPLDQDDALLFAYTCGILTRLEQRAVFGLPREGKDEFKYVRAWDLAQEPDTTIEAEYREVVDKGHRIEARHG